MKTWHIPAIVYATICLIFVAFVGGSAPLLPDSAVASHFNGAGNPDGSMARNAYLLFTCGMGVGMSLFIIGTIYACSFLPVSMINIPNKGYWLAPAQRVQSCRFLFAHSFHLGSLILCFMGGLHFLTILANRSVPKHLPGGPFAMLGAFFGIGLIIWVAVLYWRFPKPK